MNNSWLTLLLWVFLAIAEVFKAFFILKICDREPYFIKKEVYLSTYVVYLLVTITAFFMNVSYSTLWYPLNAILIGSIFLSINDTFSNRIWITATVLIFLATLNTIATCIIMYFYSAPEEIGDCIRLLFIFPLLACVYFLKYHSRVVSDLLNKHSIRLVKVVLLLSAVFQCGTAGILYLENKGYIVYTTISFICVMLLCSLTWFILNLHKKVTELSAEQNTLLTAQKEYYLSLLEKEEETRRYRHDMNNHLMCLDALLDKDDNPELKEYINNLQKEFRPISDSIYQTGNTIITAITAHYLSSVDENTSVNITGRLSKELKINNTDLCSIYSNLVKNAVEELDRIEKGLSKEINISFKTGEKFAEISVSNTMKTPSSFRGFASKTVKEDKENHGYGIQNINRTVAKNNGTFNINKDNDLFCCKVILPLLNTHTGKNLQVTPLKEFYVH